MPTRQEITDIVRACFDEYVAARNGVTEAIQKIDRGSAREMIDLGLSLLLNADNSYRVPRKHLCASVAEFRIKNENAMKAVIRLEHLGLAFDDLTTDAE